MSIFKDCDIRGIYGTELNENDAYNIGRAIGTMLGGRSTVVGGDVRVSTPMLKSECIRGLFECGAKVIDIGTITTPAMYFAKKHLNTYGGVMITASHNPSKYNGIKLMLGEVPVTSETIKEIERIISAGAYSAGAGSIEKKEILREYSESFEGKFSPEGIKIVTDCCDGASSLIVPATLNRMGAEVKKLFCGVDGTFPNRNPNPAVYSNLTKLQENVRKEKADMGAAFDGDGDRVVFCDENGSILTGEETLVLLTRNILKSGDSLVYDQKSSSIVREAVTAMGAEPVMERSGHAFIKKNFLERSSALAGEISGHFFFGDIGYDDGLYATLCLAEILKKSGKKLSELTADIPEKLITPDIRVPVGYSMQQTILDKIKYRAQNYNVSLMDGVRIETVNGWILVRKSVTEEVMTVRMEAKDHDKLNELSDLLTYFTPELGGAVKEAVSIMINDAKKSRP